MTVSCSPGLSFFSAGWYQASDCSTLATMFLCSSWAPLLTPVVPPVYCRNAVSFSVTSTGFSDMRSPSASTSFQRSELASVYSGTIFLTLRTTKLTSRPLAKPSMSPIAQTTTVLVGTLSTTCCSVVAKFSRMKIASAPESLSWCSSSRGVYSGLTLTTVQPARSTPASTTGYCSTFGIMMATRLPLVKPRLCSQAPIAADWMSRSPKVSGLPMQLYAVWPLYFLNASSSNCTSDLYW